MNIGVLARDKKKFLETVKDYVPISLLVKCHDDFAEDIEHNYYFYIPMNDKDSREVCGKSFDRIVCNDDYIFEILSRISNPKNFVLRLNHLDFKLRGVENDFKKEI